MKAKLREEGHSVREGTLGGKKGTQKRNPPHQTLVQVGSFGTKIKIFHHTVFREIALFVSKSLITWVWLVWEQGDENKCLHWWTLHFVFYDLVSYIDQEKSYMLRKLCSSINNIAMKSSTLVSSTAVISPIGTQHKWEFCRSILCSYGRSQTS